MEAEGGAGEKDDASVDAILSKVAREWDVVEMGPAWSRPDIRSLGVRALCVEMNALLTKSPWVMPRAAVDVEKGLPPSLTHTTHSLTHSLSPSLSLSLLSHSLSLSLSLCVMPRAAVDFETALANMGNKLLAPRSVTRMCSLTRMCSFPGTRQHGNTLYTSSCVLFIECVLLPECVLLLEWVLFPALANMGIHSTQSLESTSFSY
jgi:hypothetical protein